MKIFFASLLVLFLAVSGYHLSFRRLKVPLFARKFYLTGLEFLFLGLLLGPGFLNILDVETRSSLEPLTALLLGWIGLLFGFQFEIAKLRRFPASFLSSALVESGVTLIIIFAGVFAALAVISDAPVHARLVAAFAFACAGACTAQTGLALVSPNTAGKNAKTIRLLRYIAGIDGLMAMLVLLPVFIYFPANSAAGSPWRIFGADTLVALVSFIGILLLFILFLAQRRDESELALITIGMVILLSGIAAMRDFSPLIANFFTGLFLVNITREKEKIFSTLVSIEKPVYLLLLVFLGSTWQLDSIWLPAMAAGYALIRLAGKALGGVAVASFSPAMRGYPNTLGLGLLEQGGLSLAIIWDFQQGFPYPMTGAVVSVMLLAVIFNDLAGPALMNRLLRKG